MYIYIYVDILLLPKLERTTKVIYDNVRSCGRPHKFNVMASPRIANP